MDTVLADFLENHTPLMEESTVWGNGAFPLIIKSYLTDKIPPLIYITSVRCILFSKESVLVVRNRDGIHIVPGGRVEKGEMLDETLKRELLEETGWSIANPTVLGFMHFHHLKPKPPEYKYPHPDFLQLMYMADADEFFPDTKISQDYEIESKFCSPTEVDSLGISGFPCLYLGAALKSRQR